MSDLKLYKGINNIDDDLIEEANCKQKPVVHHCYALAASAAAIFIAAGATGIVHNTNTVRKPAPSESVVITEDNVTTAICDNNSAITTDAAVSTTHGSVTSAQTSVSYSKTSTINQGSRTQTTAVSVSTSTASAVSRKTAADTVNQDDSDIQNHDFEYEGSIIMKKYAALLSSLLVLSNGTGTAASAQTYVPENECLSSAETFKNYIEENNLDLDLNCDGKIDIFDLYAFFRAELCADRNKLAGTVEGTIPDYIQKKYDALPRAYQVEKTYIDSITGKEETGLFDYTLDSWSFIEYYFTYEHEISLDYFEPEFYIDNCPDDYQDDFPYDMIRRDGKHWDMWNYQKTKFIKKESDGSYRFYNEDDAASLWKQAKEYCGETRMRFMDGVTVSPIHEFISDLRYNTHDTGADYVLMKDFIEKGYADPDIDSNGVFDFEDIIKIAIMAGRHSSGDQQTFIDYLFYPDLNEYQYFDNEYYRDNINEDEWNKAFHFLDAAANYFNIYSDENLRYLTQYYLTYNEIDPKYYDPLYYEEKNIVHYNPNSYSNGEVFQNLGYYESFSIKYGPKSKENNEEQSEEMKKRFGFTEKEVNQEFPLYYKKVKTGVLPKPDIDLSGKIDVADYNILYNLSYEMSSPYGGDYTSTMIKHHPELTVEIGISQEVRDNFNTNFDFNNNGISGDSLEIDCMMMYIINELGSHYREDELNKALDNFYVEHPELQYYEIFKEKLSRFNKTRKVYVPGPESVDSLADIADSVNVLKNYSSLINIESLPTGNGDANGDGNVDIADAVLIMQYIANPSKYGVNGSDENHITDEGCFRADVDGYGVTNMDALTIQKYLLGLCSIE